MTAIKRSLSIALGRTPLTEPLFMGAVASPMLEFAFAPFAPIHRAFAPMVREAAFEVSELAIATFLQARAAGKPVVLLPVVLSARFQEAALLCLRTSSLRGPGDLRGKRIGVRAYSQTTGMWLRCVLADDFGVAPQEIAWTTFEGAHVQEYVDPPWVSRAAPGADMVAMLREGALDAVIVGNEFPEGDDLRTVFPDPAAAGQAFLQRHGFTPVNHLLTVRQDIATEAPEIVAELLRLFAALGPPMPVARAALTPVIELAVRTSVAQGLLARPLSLAEVWAPA